MAELMRCDEAETLLAVHAMGELDRDNVAGLTDHLEGCSDCRRAGAEYIATATLLAVAVDPATPPDRLRTNIMAAVYADASGSGAKVRGPSFLRRTWQSLPNGRVWTLGGALTSVALAGVVILVSTHRTPPTTTPPRAVAVRTATVSGAGPLASADVHGDVVYADGMSTAVLTVKGLAPPTPNPNMAAPVYEVWLERPDHSVLAASYLTLQPDGTTWMAPMAGDMKSYISVIVTIEPHVGDQTPLGTVVANGSMSASSVTG